MPSRTQVLVLLITFSSVAFGAARSSGEEGTRAHRKRLSAGWNHACALLDDGTVQCWGDNIWGQLGDGTFTTRIAPVAVSNLNSVVSIAVGRQHSCAILGSQGTVRCWGRNDGGQLGNGTSSQSINQPVFVTGLTNVVALTAGDLHTCAVRVDGTVWCWGDNLEGQLGNGGLTNFSLVPVQVEDLIGAVTVEAGANHTCALLSDSSLKCWGENGFGELGNNSFLASNVPVSTGRLSATPGVGAVDLAAGGLSTCARLSDASVSCWGDNGSGQFGNGTSGLNNLSAVPVASKVSPTVVALAAGTHHSCAILADGTVSCWGSDTGGQLGDGGTGSVSLPGPPVPGVTNAVEIAGGLKFTCALTVAGAIRCWGDNAFGQHGDGTNSPQGIDSVAGITGTFLGHGVTAGNQFTCGRRGSGAAACWGAGAQGQLGSSASVSSSNAVAVTGIANAIGLSAGHGSHACAIDAAGGARCWGDNSRGRLGNGTLTSSNQPVPVINSGPLFVAISAGDLHTCAVAVGGTVSCWGAGDRGQLGAGDTADSSAPRQVLGITNAVAVAAGNQFTCVLLSSGTVWCWGDNSANQLGGLISEAFSATPQTVFIVAGILTFQLYDIVGITAGASHACAVTATGTAACWGSNSRGQIGNGSTLPAPNPAFVRALNDAVSLSAGAFFTCAAQAGGGASCWGANDSGELSAIDSVDHLTPTSVGRFVFCGSLCPGGRAFFPISTVTAITTGKGSRFIFFPSPHLVGQEHACALFTSGAIDCWGNNAQGEIGDGTTTNQPRPTPVNSFLANIDPAGTLRNGRIAEVTALVNCEAGAQAHIILTLEQGTASGTGHAEAKCESRLIQVPMTVPAQGPSGFQAGTTTAHVEAIVRSEGAIFDDTHWTRQVVLSSAK